MTNLENIDNDIFDTKTVLCEKMENLNPNPCELRIPISQAGPITQPGSYCLTNNITGSIKIFGVSNVELDLNNQKIIGITNGLEVVDATDITIKNGIIEDGFVGGILVSSCTNVEIFDIDFIDNPIGINVVTASCVRVSDCTFRGFTDAALTIDDTNNGQFTNCMMKFNNNSSEVVFAQNSSNLFFEKLFMNNNSSSISSLIVFRLNTCESCLIKECQANNNADSFGSLEAFFSINCNDIKFINCIVSSNEARFIKGFNNSNCEDILYDYCCSNSNVSTDALFAHGFSAGFGRKTFLDSFIPNIIF